MTSVFSNDLPISTKMRSEVTCSLFPSIGGLTVANSIRGLNEVDCRRDSISTSTIEPSGRRMVVIRRKVDVVLGYWGRVDMLDYYNSVFCSTV